MDYLRKMKIALVTTLNIYVECLKHGSQRISATSLFHFAEGNDFSQATRLKNRQHATPFYFGDSKTTCDIFFP